MLWRRRAAPLLWHAWESRPGTVPPTPGGRPFPLLFSAVRQGRCQLRDTVLPTLVRLTRRTLEGGPAAPSNIFYVLIQDHAVTSGRRDRSSPSLSALRGHHRHCRNTPDPVATSRRCWGVRGQDVATTATVPRTGPRQRHPRTDPPRRPVNQPLHRRPRSRPCTSTWRTTSPRRLNRSEIHQNGRQLRSTARHISTRREVVRYACKLLPSWPIKGGAAPPPSRRGDTGRRIAITHSFSAFSPILALASIKPLGLGGHASSPASLVATPLRAPRCEQYSAPSTPLLDGRPRPEPG
jgi:hypothetical protein